MSLQAVQQRVQVTLRPALFLVHSCPETADNWQYISCPQSLIPRPLIFCFSLSSLSFFAIFPMDSYISYPLVFSLFLIFFRVFILFIIFLLLFSPIASYCPPLWSSSQSSWLLTQTSRVRFPALPEFMSGGGSGTGSTQPL
jgi:hypothetical protein